MDTSAVPEGRLSDDELLRAALSAWADQTQELLRWIEGQGDAVSDTRSPKQVMALGSFRTHLVWASRRFVIPKAEPAAAPDGHHNTPREWKETVPAPVDRQDRSGWL